MRTTIIPAQITTVEDKIAGSLNMTQILILMFPILWTAIIYVLLPVSMKLTPYKLGLILLVIGVCITLATRIKEKIVAEWLGILLRYHFRPRFWIFNKNDLTGRTADISDIPNISVTPRKSTKNYANIRKVNLDVADLVKLEHLIDSGKVAVRYQLEKK